MQAWPVMCLWGLASSPFDLIFPISGPTDDERFEVAQSAGGGGGGRSASSSLLASSSRDKQESRNVTWNVTGPDSLGVAFCSVVRRPPAIAAFPSPFTSSWLFLSLLRGGTTFSGCVLPKEGSGFGFCGNCRLPAAMLFLVCLVPSHDLIGMEGRSQDRVCLPACLPLEASPPGATTGFSGFPLNRSCILPWEIFPDPLL